MLCPFCKEEIAESAMQCNRCLAMLGSAPVPAPQEKQQGYISWLLWSKEGRLNRKPLWILTLVVLASYFLLSAALIFAFGEEELFEIGEVKNGLAFSIPFFLVLPITVCVLLFRPLVKRRKDRGKIKVLIKVRPEWFVRWFYISMLTFLITGAVCLLNLHLGSIPEERALYVLIMFFIATLMFCVQLYCRRGTVGDNEHGKDPLQ